MQTEKLLDSISLIYAIYVMVRSETTIEKMNIWSIKMRKTIYLFIVTLALNGCVMTQTHKSLVPSKPSAVPDYFSTPKCPYMGRS